MPHPRKFRLIAKPPFVVTVGAVEYRVVIEPVTGAPQWRLSAKPPTGASDWMLCHAGEKLEWLERELYRTGFEVMHPSVPSAIMEQAVKDGLACRI